MSQAVEGRRFPRGQDRVGHTECEIRYLRGLVRVNYLKVDVEGFEPQVLGGAIATIKRVMGTSVPADVFLFLSELGLAPHVISAPPPKNFPQEPKAPFRPM
jgi:hypothetical protein